MKRGGYLKRSSKPMKRTPLKRTGWKRKAISYAKPLLKRATVKIKPTSPKKKSNAQLKKELWKVFSLFIRRRDGFQCFTCGRKGEGSGIHAGHFIAKSVGGILLYFHEDNVHAQCYHCNINLGGNSFIYGQRLGETKCKELYALKEKITKKEEKITKDYPFMEKINYYKELLTS